MKLNWGYIAASFVLGGLIFWGGNVMIDEAIADVPVEQSTAPTPTLEPAPPVSALPPCPTEDSDDCVWDAAAQGNGEGRSFIAWHGEMYYLDGQDYVTIGDETIEGHYSTVDDGQAYVLYCEAPLAIGIDVDDKGNEWAGCM